MHYLIMFIVSAIPVIAVYIWFRLAKYEFSLVWFLIALLMGAAAFFPALVLQYLLNFPVTPGRGAMFYHLFIRVAFTEEVSRLLMLFIFFGAINLVKKKNSPDQPLSWNTLVRGTATGFIVGLGFAILENIVYAASVPQTLLMRAVTAAPLHAACGARIGAAAVLFPTNPIQAIFRLITATAIHGIYNFMVAMPGFPAVMAILIALSALITAILSIRSGEPQETGLTRFH